MSQQLVELLKSHAFYRRALDHRDRMSIHDVHTMKEAEGRAFRDILTFSSDDPRVTLTQIRFLLTSISELAPSGADAGDVRGAAERVCDRMASMVQRQESEATIRAANDLDLLNAMSDRVAVFDRDYRYKFTNAANLRFHGEALRDFVGRPNWDVTGKRFFERANKPLLDAAFAGRAGHGYSAHADSKIYSTTYNPIRDADGEIRTVILVTRDVSPVGIPTDIAVQLEGRPRKGLISPRP